MIPHERFQLPPEKEQKIHKAIVLEWMTIGFLVSITIVMYLTMGSSQAMKTAWIEDVLSLIPPISFLIAIHMRDRGPDTDHPWGYRRATLLSFLMAAVAILILGLYMLYDAGHALITQHHPTIGHFDLFGWHVWAGWVMIAALIYSIIPVVILGRMKLPLGEELHEKTLHADAQMNKADWMTAAAAIIGILGVGAGLWWADSAAAGFIALEVTRDGIKNIRRAMSDLLDGRPRSVEQNKPLDLDERIRACVASHEGVLDVGVRLREDGHVVTGEVLVVLAHWDDAARRLKAMTEAAIATDWRVHGLVLVPVAEINPQGTD